MTRKLKPFGLALLVVAAFGALAAQGASATDHEFHSDGPTTIYTGQNEQPTKFAVGSAGTVECDTAELEATQVGTQVSANTYQSDTLTVTVHHSECTFGGKAATVNFNHCAVILDSDTGATEGKEHADAEIECSADSTIEIDTALCTITISPQIYKHAVRYKNHTASAILVEVTATKIVVGKTKTTESQTGCLLFPTGAIGTLTSGDTFECFKDEGSPLTGTPKTTPTGTTEGSPTGCTVTNA